MPKEVKVAVAVHPVDENGNPLDSVWYQPGDSMPDEHVELVTNPAVWGEDNDEEMLRKTRPNPSGAPQVMDQMMRAELEQEQGGAAASGDEDEGYASWTAADLKTELQERGLTVSGSKAELVARLEEDDAAGAMDTSGN